jgi:fructose-bisphosphate aldolase class 1
MKKRKSILLIDESIESSEVKYILETNNINFIEYNIIKFGRGCCGHLPTTTAPSIFAPEGVFKGKDSIEKYITGIVLNANTNKKKI